MASVIESLASYVGPMKQRTDPTGTAHVAHAMMVPGHDPLFRTQLLQHLPRRAQAVRVAVYGRDQARIDLGELALQYLLVLLVFALRAVCFQRLEGFYLLGPLLALREEIGVGACASRRLGRGLS